jgi:hypothetical protein
MAAEPRQIGGQSVVSKFLGPWVVLTPVCREEASVGPLPGQLLAALTSKAPLEVTASHTLSRQVLTPGNTTNNYICVAPHYSFDVE